MINKVAMLRRLAVAAPAVLAVAGGAVVLIPNYFCINAFTELTQCYRNGYAIPVSPHIHNLLLEVKSDLLASETVKASFLVNLDALNRMKPFTVFGSDMYHLGWNWFSVGGRVGIPQHMLEKQLQTTGIVILDEPVKWHSAPGIKLKKALTLSDEARKFAIARETLHLSNYEIPYRLFINISNILLPFLLCKSLHARLDMNKMPKRVKYLMYTMTVTLAASFWFMLQDGGAVKRETDIDECLAALSPAYLRGGLQFYDSLVERNLAMRRLLRNDGPKAFTAVGNIKTTLRTKHLPIVERAEFFRAKVAESEAINAEA